MRFMKTGISGIGQRNQVQNIIRYMEKEKVSVFFMDRKTALSGILSMGNLSDRLQIKEQREGIEDDELRTIIR